MRDRQKTIEALRRLAERPGTPQEGETARRKLREIEAQEPRQAASQRDQPDVPAWAKNALYVQYKGEIDIEEWKAFMGIKSAGYVPQRKPKTPVTTWEDAEGAVRRHIYRRGETGDID